MNNSILIIIGMHRSGTSLTAQWLNACGLHLGHRLLEDDFSNQKGHYEDLDFLELHKAILKKNNLIESGIEGDLSKIDISDYLRAKIKYTYNLKNELNKQWGWKDPRTCLFLNEYINIIPEAKFLIVFRDLAEVRTSLIKRDLDKMLLQKKTMSLINQFKWTFFKTYYLKKWAKLKNQAYLNANIYYHKAILNFINNTTKRDNIIVCQLNDLQTKDHIIHEQLSKWGFSLKKKRFSEIFDKTLFNKRFNVLNDFKKMTDKEEEIFNKLKQYAI